MSEIDIDDSKREQNPHRINKTEEIDHSTPLRSQDNIEETNPMVNNKKSILSEATLEEQYQPVNLNGAREETFYRKNKKAVWIAGGILLGVMVVLAIVLPLTLGGGGDNPVPPNPPVPPTPVPPEPVDPDPFEYQEFNPFMTDPTKPTKISTFEANFNLKFNYTAFSSSGKRVRKQPYEQIPEQLRKFMGFEKLQEDERRFTPRVSKKLRAKNLSDNLNGTSYKPMDPLFVVNNTNNGWAQNININVQTNSNNQARVLITNPDNDVNDTLRRRVNQNLFPRPGKEIESRLQQVGFKYNETASFAFNFTDIYTEETLISTMYRKMLVTDLYSEVGFVLPTQRCFGLGQRNGKFQLDQGTYTFNVRGRDESLPQDDGLGGKSGNHIHPFMLCQTEIKKDFFGMFFASTGPQVFEIVKFYNSTKMVLNYIAIGGVIEYYVYVRGTAQEIISRYHNTIGNPMMPSYYALGVYHGSNAYGKWTQVKDVYDNYNGALTGEKQALEGVFVDKFNEQSHWTFTVDTVNFPNLGSEVDKIHANNQRIIFHASFALAANNSYPWYVQASQAKCLVQSLPTPTLRGPLSGILAQTQVQYLDSFSSCFDSFMASALPVFESTVAHGLDGLLVKDAHAPNHVSGQYTPEASKVVGRQLLGDDPQPPRHAVNEEMVGTYSPYQVYNGSEVPAHSTYYLPFIPAFKYSGNLDNMSISLNSSLGDDSSNGRYSNLFVRNGMAGSALKKTYNVIQQNIKKNTSRTMLFSDSTWAGSGAYSVGLVTDLYRSWGDMQNVISQALALSMYGMSATMVDTCGSLGPMDEELCTRWTQLATYMPMVRNYYNGTYRDPATGIREKTPGSEPWLATTDQQRLAYAALGDRLRLSRYIYTQMYLTHVNGGSLVKPLFFDFPKDDQCFLDSVQSSTYMLGNSLKVTPLLTKIADGGSYQGYFPQGVWVSVYNTSSIVNALNGINASLPVDSAQTNIHQKSGSIIPYLNNNKNLRTTRDVEQQLRTTFRIVRDPITNFAEGDIMIDDGVTPNLFSPPYMDIYQYQVFDKNFSHYNIRYSAGKTINFQLQNGDSDYKPSSSMNYQFLEQIDILNAQDIADTDFACSLNKSWIPLNMTVYYSESTKTLTIKPNTNTLTYDQLLMIKFGNSKKDVSFCNGFSYAAVIADEDQGDTYVRFNLTSNQAKGVLEDLVAEFLLLDDEGTIAIEITTISDYYAEPSKSKYFRPPQPEYYNQSNIYFPGKIPKNPIFTYLQVNTQDFNYQILNELSDVIYQSDPFRIMITDNFVIDAGTFVAYNLTGRPIMGIGERAGRAMFKNQHDTVHTIWPYDAPNPIDDGKPPGKNMYGYQPVYYYQTMNPKKLQWVAVFDIGTYASDYFVNTDIDGQGTAKITKVTVGGIIQKVIFQGDKIEHVIRKYQKLTGFQTVAPMWAFGWNQCKFGYVNDSVWWNVYQNYTTFNLPLDTMWADIDYMDDYKVFTISKQTYANLSNHVDQIRADGRKFVPIIDNAIAVRQNAGYAPFDTGVAQNVFIVSPNNQSQPATGAVWPGQAYYPDFFKQQTVNWWSNNFDAFSKMIKFDGIWLDMNEPSSTCTGYCDQSQRSQNSIKYKLPYLPGQRDLETQALGLDAVHLGLPKVSGGFWSEIDARSLYALKETQATANYLRAGGNRSFVLSRSNVPGLQKYAFTWTADNWSKEEWLATSIDSIYEYNLFGMPMMGSDICGFNLDASPQLCTRWHQLGSFYPFSRNHKNSVWKQTEPFQFNFTVPELSDGRTYTDLIRTALLQRYSIIRYIYSCFHSIGEYGGAFFKPLYYEFQEDVTTFDDNSTQRNILLGDALKLSIQVQNFEQVSTEYQFPSSRWCQVMPDIDSSKCWDTSAGASTLQRLDSGIADYQVHLRGGRIVPYQDAHALKVTKTLDLMNSPTELLVLTNAVNSPIVLPSATYTAQAAGFMYLDDGYSATNIARFDLSVISNVNGTFTFQVTKIRDIPAPLRSGSGKAATLSAITFLWASGTGYDKIQTAKIVESSGATHDLIAPIHNSAQDTLRVNLETIQAGQTWTFWDINTITLSN